MRSWLISLRLAFSGLSYFYYKSEKTVWSWSLLQVNVAFVPKLDPTLFIYLFICEILVHIFLYVCTTVINMVTAVSIKEAHLSSREWWACQEASLKKNTKKFVVCPSWVVFVSVSHTNLFVDLLH